MGKLRNHFSTFVEGFVEGSNLILRQLNTPLIIKFGRILSGTNYMSSSFKKAYPWDNLKSCFLPSIISLDSGIGLSLDFFPLD